MSKTTVAKKTSHSPKKWLRPLFFMSTILLMSSPVAGFYGDALPKAKAVHSITVKSTELSFAKPVVDVLDSGYARLTLGDLPQLTESGCPALPYRLVRLVLPPEGTILGVDVAVEGERWLPGHILPEPARAQVPISLGGSRGVLVRDPEAYEAEHFWPPDRIQILSEQYLDGYRLLLLRLFPLRYGPEQKRVQYVPRMQVKVRLAGVPNRDDPLSSPGRRFSRRIWEMVDNPHDVLVFGSRSLRPSRPLAVGGSLADPAQPCDYVIITSRALHAAFEPLAEWRRGQGLAVGIFDVEDIIAAYDGRLPSVGSDDATRLRNFLIDAYATWANSDHPLRYVLLGGDTEIIPARSMYVRAGIYETDAAHPLVSDAYYAGLDGTWDTDGDGHYGEGTVENGGTGAAGEEADLYAELFVGRVPVNELDSGAVDQEARNWVTKVLTYEDDPHAGVLNRALWLGERLDSQTYGGDSKDLILGIVPELDIVRLYDSIASWSVHDLTAQLEEGVHLLNHLGHANSQKVLRMSASDVHGLTNAPPFLVHSQGCLAAAIATTSREAIAEHFITAEHGAFAFIGNTSYGWYMPGGTNGASQMYDWEFFDALYQEDIPHLGRALQDAKQDLLGQVGAVGPERWVYLELSLLGDPYTPIVTKYAQPVTYISTPARRDRLAGSVQVMGCAQSGSAPGAGFGDYGLYWGTGREPGNWTPIVTSVMPVAGGPLGVWDTGLLPDGTYTLRLEADDGTGLTSLDHLVVQVDHAQISSPASGSYLRAGELVTVRGNASRGDLMDYALDYGYDGSSLAWMPILTSTAPVVSGTMALWDTSVITEAGDYTLRLTVNGDDYQGESCVSLTLDPSYASGWPRMVDSRFSNESLAVGDLDGDGDLEVVASEGMRVCGGALEGGRCGGYGMLLYVWDARGELLPGWPRMPGSDNRLTAPCLADLDGDGTLEILVGSIDGAVYAYRYDGSMVDGWPQRTMGEVHAAPACADLDNDGLPEIVACDIWGDVYVWRGDGTLVAGWPQDAGGEANCPLLADLDADGSAEVIVASESGRVSAWRGDGTSLPGWPIEESSRFLAAPVAGDLDGDGQLEIVAPSEDMAYVWHGDGSPLAGWPKTDVTGNVGSSPALVDLDGDGDVEIISVDEKGDVQVWHHDGQVTAGWGTAGLAGALSSPVVGDIDGDGDLEVIVVSDDHGQQLLAYHHDGSPVRGWPRRVPKRETPAPNWGRLSSATLIDLDGDGRLELGLSIERYVYFWRLDGMAQGGAPWPTFQGNAQRTGKARPPVSRGYLPLVVSPMR